MSPDDNADPLDPRLQAWIDEAPDPVTKEGAHHAEAKDAELLALFKDAVRDPPREMSEENAAAILDAVRATYRRQSGRASLRDAVLGIAAVLCGLALGVATLSRFPPSPVPNPQTNTVEIIKQVSFESIHEGRVVQFQLELSRVR